MILTARDKLFLSITIFSWIICGALAWLLWQPALLLIALGVSGICSKAVMRIRASDRGT